MIYKFNVVRIKDWDRFFQKEVSFRRKKGGLEYIRNSSMIFPFGPLFNTMSEGDGGFDKHQKGKTD